MNFKADPESMMTRIPLPLKICVQQKVENLLRKILKQEQRE